MFSLQVTSLNLRSTCPTSIHSHKDHSLLNLLDLLIAKIAQPITLHSVEELWWISSKINLIFSKEQLSDSQAQLWTNYKLKWKELSRLKISHKLHLYLEKYLKFIKLFEPINEPSYYRNISNKNDQNLNKKHWKGKKIINYFILA